MLARKRCGRRPAEEGKLQHTPGNPIAKRANLALHRKRSGPSCIYGRGQRRVHRRAEWTGQLIIKRGVLHRRRSGLGPGLSMVLGLSTGLGKPVTVDVMGLGGTCGKYPQQAEYRRQSHPKRVWLERNRVLSRLYHSVPSSGGCISMHSGRARRALEPKTD